MKRDIMKVLYCGFNGFGQFPTASSCVSTPTQFPISDIKDISISWSYTCISTGEAIYLFGFVGEQSHQSKQINKPDSNELVQISCSQRHMLVLNSAGECWKFCMKNEEWHKLDNFTTTETDPCIQQDKADPVISIHSGPNFDMAFSQCGRAFIIPSPIYEPGARVTSVACGNEHCLLLTEIGSVFSWGSSSRGQLGHGDLESEEETARQVDALAGLHITQLAAGGWHSAAVSEWGDIYTWGWNSSGQLGFPMEEIIGLDCSVEEPKSKKRKSEEDKYIDAVSVSSLPQVVNWVSCDTLRVKTVGCGSRHTIMLLDDGSVWGCGWNAYGQLGISPKELLCSWQMRQLKTQDNKVQQIHCDPWGSLMLLE